MKKLAGYGLSVALALVSAAVFANSWDGPYKPNKGPDKEINTLVITGNYLKPRLMAELIQVEAKQPILLLPSQPGGMIFFLPSNDTAMEVDSANFAKFLKFANPKRIILIGDERYVPESYAKQINPNLTVWRVKNNDWKQVAADAEDLLRLNNLSRDFNRLSDQIDSGRLYQPGAELPLGVPQPTDQILTPIEPVVVPEEPVAPVVEPVAEPIIIKDDVVIPK
jgi:hypothetical protein